MNNTQQLKQKIHMTVNNTDSLTHIPNLSGPSKQSYIKKITQPLKERIVQHENTIIDLTLFIEYLWNTEIQTS